MMPLLVARVLNIFHHCLILFLVLVTFSVCFASVTAEHDYVVSMVFLQGPIRLQKHHQT